MSTLRLPAAPEGTGVYVYRVTLEQSVYELRLVHNAREDRWYLDIRDAEGSPIRLGLKLISQWPVTARIADSRRPPGEILVLDTTGQDYDGGLNDLLERLAFVYEESAA